LRQQRRSQPRAALGEKHEARFDLEVRLTGRRASCTSGMGASVATPNTTMSAGGVKRRPRRCCAQSEIVIEI
jgi:hypothetical protein